LANDLNQDLIDLNNSVSDLYNELNNFNEILNSLLIYSRHLIKKREAGKTEIEVLISGNKIELTQ
jgi:hypothetical protein